MGNKELDKQKLASIIDLLRDDLSIQQFGKIAGVAAISISKIKAGAYVPSVSTIKKLCRASRHPQKEELFVKFMALAGHETTGKECLEEERYAFEEGDTDEDFEIEGTKLESWVKRKYERAMFSSTGSKEKWQEKIQTEIRNELMVLSLLRSRLEDQGYRVEQSFDTKNVFEVASTGRMRISGEMGECWFHVISPRIFSLRYVENLYGKMARLQLNADRKISFVVYDEKIFDSILQYAPIGLRMNVSIIYIDLEYFPIKMYENVVVLYNANDKDIMLRLAEERYN